MSSRVFVAILLASILPLSGCGASDSTAAAPAVRDSAGIRIVENHVPMLSARRAWRVSEPALEIGVVAGEPAQQLDRVIGATRLRDGRIVIANSGTQELRFFDGAGRHLMTVGGRGGGPGEFSRMFAFGRIRGDTLVVSDMMPGIMSRFDARGEYLGRVNVDLPGRDRPVFLTDGSLLLPLYQGVNWGTEVELFAIGQRTADADGLFRPPFHLVRFSADGADADTIGRYTGDEIFKFELGGRLRLTRSRPFARHDIYSPAGDDIAVMYNDRPEIRRFSADGMLETIIRFEPAEPDPIGDVDRDAIRDSVLSSVDESNIPRFTRWLAEVPYPATRPVAHAILGDAEGNIWLLERSAAGEPVERWSVFAADGMWLQRIDLPAGTVPLEIGAGYLLGLWRDPLDVEFVRLHRITKPGT